MAKNFRKRLIHRNAAKPPLTPTIWRALKIDTGIGVYFGVRKYGVGSRNVTLVVESERRFGYDFEIPWTGGMRIVLGAW